MRSGGAKQKGNNFENKTAKDLSLWLTRGKREDVLIRSQNSGGRATMLSYSGRNFMSQAGDICAVEQAGLPLTEVFVIECKHYSDLGVDGLIFRTRKDGITAHWAKLLKECETYKKLPFYIARQNNRPTLVGLNQSGISLFNLESYVEIDVCHMGLKILSFQNFLKHSKISNLPGITEQVKKPLVFKKRS